MKLVLTTCLFMIFASNICYANEFLDRLETDGEIRIGNGSSTTYHFRKDGTFYGHPSRLSGVAYGLTINGRWYAGYPFLIYGKWNVYHSTGNDRIDYKKMELHITPYEIDEDGVVQFYFFHEELLSITRIQLASATGGLIPKNT